MFLIVSYVMIYISGNFSPFTPHAILGGPLRPGLGQAEHIQVFLCSCRNL